MKKKITGLLMAMIMLMQLCPYVLSAGADKTFSYTINTAYSPTLDLYAAAGASGGVFVSKNRTDWALSKSGTNPIGTNGGKQLLWLNMKGEFIVLDTGTESDIAVSRDGVNWTEYDNITVDGESVVFSAINYVGGEYVAGGVDGHIYTSKNLSEWTKRTETGYLTEGCSFRGITASADGRYALFYTETKWSTNATNTQPTLWVGDSNEENWYTALTAITTTYNDTASTNLKHIYDVKYSQETGKFYGLGGSGSTNSFFFEYEPENKIFTRQKTKSMTANSMAVERGTDYYIFGGANALLYKVPVSVIDSCADYSAVSFSSEAIQVAENTTAIATGARIFSLASGRNGVIASVTKNNPYGVLKLDCDNSTYELITKYYSKNFIVPEEEATTPTTDGMKNILQNGSFEEYDTYTDFPKGWSSDGMNLISSDISSMDTEWSGAGKGYATVTYTEEAAYGGSGVGMKMKFDSGKSGWGGRWISLGKLDANATRMRVSPGQKYIFRGWYNMMNSGVSSDFFNLNAAVWNSDTGTSNSENRLLAETNNVFKKVSGDTDGFVMYSNEVTIPEGAVAMGPLQVRVNLSSARTEEPYFTVYADDIALEKEGRTSTAYAYDGTRALKIAGYGKREEWESELIDVQPGVTAYYSIYAKADGTENAYARVNFYNSEKELTDAVISKSVSQSSEDWKLLTGEATVPADAAYVSLSLIAEGNGNVYFDKAALCAKTPLKIITAETNYIDASQMLVLNFSTSVKTEMLENAISVKCGDDNKEVKEMLLSEADSRVSLYLESGLEANKTYTVKVDSSILKSSDDGLFAGNDTVTFITGDKSNRLNVDFLSGAERKLIKEPAEGKIEIEGTVSVTEEAAVVAAVRYDGEYNLLEMKLVDITGAEAKGSVFFKSEFASCSPTDIIEVYCWNNYDEIKPITEKKIIEPVFDPEKVSLAISATDELIEPGSIVELDVTVINSSYKKMDAALLSVEAPGFAVALDNDEDISIAVPGDESQTVTLRYKVLEGGRDSFVASLKNDEINITTDAEGISVSGPGYYAGDPHTHSVHSDGTGTIAENVAYAYDKNMLSWLISTDHHKYSPKDETALETAKRGGSFINLSSVEFSPGNYNGHSLNFNTGTGFAVGPGTSAALIENEEGTILENWQKIIDKTNELGGMFYFAHPYFTKYSYKGTIPDLKNYTGVEVWNMGAEALSEENQNAFDEWDKLNSRDVGKHYPGLTSGDGHRDYLMGCVRDVAYMSELSEENIWNMLKKGNFIGTNGPEIRFDIDGVGVSDTLFIKGDSKKVNFNINALCPVSNLTKVQIVRNKVSGKYELDRDIVWEYDFSGDLTNVFSNSIELIVSPNEFYRVVVMSEKNAYGDATSPYGYAYTNNIWVEEDEKSSAADIRSIEYSGDGAVIRKLASGISYITTDDIHSFDAQNITANVSEGASLLKEYDEEKGLLTLTAIAENGYKATKHIYVVNNKE